MRAPWRLLLAILLVAFVVAVSCSGEPPAMPSLSVSARPARIDDLGETSTIKVTATKADGTPGTGSVNVSSGAGSLKSGTSLTLGTNGTAETPFTCAVSADISCSGRVAITADWNGITATTRIQVGDAGVITGTGGGAGGGAGGGTGGGGGSSDGGMTDGGATDGGATDGGSTDGGRTDGGAADAGRRDAGQLPPADGGPIENVRLFGKLDTNATWAFAELNDPTAPRIGFPPGAEANTAVVRPVTGAVIYLDNLNDQLLEFVDDTYGTGSQAVYPAMASMNDIPQPTPRCTSTNVVVEFWVWPDTGGIVYRCLNDGAYYEGSNEIAALSGLTVFALGYNGLALARTATFSPVVVDTINGMMPRGVFGLQSFVQLNVLTGGRQRSVRAAPDGFFVVLGQPSNDTLPCQLYKIAADGSAFALDTYAGPPPSVTVPQSPACSGRLDAALAFYGFGKSGTDDVVVKYPRMLGQSSVVYTEAGSTPSSFATNPPSVFTFVEPGTSLVTSP